MLLFLVIAMRMFIYSLADDVQTDSHLAPVILFPNGAPNEISGWPGPEVYTKGDYYNVSSPTITPYLVHNNINATSAVVIAPGGGYRYLEWIKEGKDIAVRFNAMGVSAFVLKYRVPSRPPITSLPKNYAPLQDAQRAIGMIRANSEKWNVDNSSIGFMGFSAGGHLTAHISTTWQHRIYPKVDASDDLSCRPDFSILLYPGGLVLSNLTINPELIVSKTHPPSFLAQAEDDTTCSCENSIGYYLALRKAKAPPSNLHIYPKGGHGFGLCHNWATYEEVCTWPEQAKLFLQDNGFIPGWPPNVNQKQNDGITK